MGDDSTTGAVPWVNEGDGPRRAGEASVRRLTFLGIGDSLNDERAQASLALRLSGEETMLIDVSSGTVLLGRLKADGTPRVVPIWFHWDGEAIVLGSPPNAPKVNVLPDNSKVALTIDRDEFPYHALLVRGTAHVETVEGVTPEYEACAERYFGEEQGQQWVEGVRQMSSHMTRISVRPEWVSILDFETRFPSAIAEAMSGQ
jgi:Pyridoxamine 5'-phosphate oxidase